TVPLPTAVGPARTVSRAGVVVMRGSWGVRCSWCVAGGEDAPYLTPAPRRAGAGGGRVLAELLDERLDLVRAEAAPAPRLRDPDLRHDRARLDLADAGQRLEQRDDLELA